MRCCAARGTRRWPAPGGNGAGSEDVLYPECSCPLLGSPRDARDARAMKVILSVTAGPHQGKEFTFDGHDTFLVGRVSDAHLRLSYDDPYFSRRHFVLEVNPPRCRLMDLKSRNGTRVNGEEVAVAEIKHGDVIKAGHTVFEVSVEGDDPE